MKKSIIRTVKMAAYYSFMGLILQSIIVTILLASPAAGQNLRDVKVSVRAVNVSLEEALQIIEKKTNFIFSYVKEELPVSERVTITADDESLYDILEVFAKDYGLTFNRINDHIAIKKSQGQTENLVTANETGTIKGKVTDSNTKEPLVGASVTLRGTTKGDYTDSKGYYEIDNVKPGKYTVAASYVGYSTTTKTIEVSAEKSIEVNFALGQSAVNLDEVIVTGSISERSIRESANPITVITPHELEYRNLTSLGSVLQTVPGVIPSASGDQQSYSGRTYDQSSSSINIRGYSPTGTLTTSTKYILDGVELYDYRSLNYLDPNQIEKIEVSRGPMSSTLYGTGSSGGIVQIFTKKGMGDVKLSLKTMLTSKESKYQDSNPFNSEYTLNLSGGKADFGYNISFDYALFPVSRWALNNGKDEKDWVVSAKINGSISNVKADLSIQYSSNDVGNYVPQTWYKIALEDGWANPERRRATSLTDYSYKNNGKVFNLNLRQAITNNLYHNLTVGISNTLSNIYYATGYTASSTPYYIDYKYNYLRSSAKYFLNLNQQLFANFKVDLTGGFEYTKGEVETLSAGFTVPFAENVTQSINTNYGGSLQLSTNATTGLFAEGVWGFMDKLFLTTGIRAEKNTSYGDDIGWYTMPRIGLTYVEAVGDFTFKPRFSWGKSTQALTPTYKAARTLTSGSYTTYYLANPNLEPQSQSGYELGTDIFFTNDYSLGITYYDQKVKNLIQLNTVSATDYTSTYQYLNVSEAFNKGFELSAKALYDRFSLDISYSHIKSTYGSGFPNSQRTPYIVKDGRTINVPSGTFFARLSYRVPSIIPWSEKGGNISIEYLWKGSELSSDYYTYYKVLTETGKYPSITYKEFDGYSQINLRGDYSVLNNLVLFLDIANLMNNQDIIAGTYPMNGRRISFGFNFSY